MSKKPKTVEVEEAGGVLGVAAVNPDTGELVDTGILEDAEIAFDPTRMHLDLSKAEKRRTTALMMAIQAYNNIIIKDAEYLREAHSLARSNGTTIRPATMDAMVEAAIQFDAFISGQKIPRSGTLREHQSTAQDPSESTPAAGAVDPSTRVEK